ncbi:hypothetical protein NA56DRAFT_708840 [Hyaloscypha hepaticicola]|uniref:Ankyrin n=1 Tax=Hyaloscypha hepaticicola TaxID=2082293 RepID=A0A2J6PQM9_9HELO|nr:hypothetical protein NA56DRAFT_708840 [Hyaloscypha hepaticicola]
MEESIEGVEHTLQKRGGRSWWRFLEAASDCDAPKLPSLLYLEKSNIHDRMVNSKTTSWQSPLHIVLGSNARYNHQVFEVSSEKKILDCVTLLSDRGASITDANSTPLHLAASPGIPVAIFLQILDEVPREDIDRVNNQGWTPLYSSEKVASFAWEGREPSYYVFEKGCTVSELDSASIWFPKHVEKYSENDEEKEQVRIQLTKAQEFLKHWEQKRLRLATNGTYNPYMGSEEVLASGSMGFSHSSSTENET